VHLDQVPVKTVNELLYRIQGDAGRAADHSFALENLEKPPQSTAGGVGITRRRLPAMTMPQVLA